MHWKENDIAIDCTYLAVYCVYLSICAGCFAFILIQMRGYLIKIIVLLCMAITLYGYVLSVM
jgi:hypothetical protein